MHGAHAISPALVPVLVLFVLVACGALLIAIANLTGWRQPRQSPWPFRLYELSRLLGLQAAESVKCEGWLSGLRCEAKPVETEGELLEVDVTLTSPRLPRGLRVERARSGSSIQVGDLAFDVALSSSGEEAEVIAALSCRTRQALLQLSAECHRFALREGVLTARVLGASPADVAHRVRQIAKNASEVADEHTDLVKALARNATKDLVAGVRLRNLEVLNRTAPAAPATLGAARKALGDPDPRVRLQGARMSRRVEALPVLRALVSSGDAHLIAGALELLVERAPPEEARAAARGFLRATQPSLLAIAVEALGRLKDLPSLAAICEACRMPGLEAVCATALGRLGDPAAEPALLGLLLDRAPLEARPAVARALGRVGTARSVTPLRERSTGSGALAEACQEAVREVQSRLAGADHGQLSIAGAEVQSGQLSVATPGEEGGEVSMVPEGIKVGNKTG